MYTWINFLVTNIFRIISSLDCNEYKYFLVSILSQSIFLFNFLHNIGWKICSYHWRIQRGVGDAPHLILVSPLGMSAPLAGPATACKDPMEKGQIVGINVNANLVNNIMGSWVTWVYILWSFVFNYLYMNTWILILKQSCGIKISETDPMYIGTECGFGS